MATKSTPKPTINQSKFIYIFLFPFLINVDQIWAPFCLQLGSAGVNQNLAFAPPFGFWACLGAKMAPRPLQEAPGSDFWLPTWWILGPKLMDFRSNLYSVLNILCPFARLWGWLAWVGVCLVTGLVVWLLGNCLVD